LDHTKNRTYVNENNDENLNTQGRQELAGGVYGNTGITGITSEYRKIQFTTYAKT